MNEKVATVINYCSNDYPFLKECLLQVRKFSEKIVVVVADHLFNGKKEDIVALERSFSEFDFAIFVIYPFIPKKIPQRIFKKVRQEALWHCISRLIGWRFVEKSIDYLLFLDVDEIINGNKFSQWLKEKKHLNCDAMRLANYWYFKSPSLQAEKWEDSILLVKRRKLKTRFLLDSGERAAIYNFVKGRKKRMLLGLDSLPMIHHFSWVKTKDQMLTKVSSWGHRNDKNWQELVEKEFEQLGLDRDFVHGYKLIKVKPFVEIEMDKKDQANTKIMHNDKNYKKNIIYLPEKNLLEMIRQRSFKDYLYCCLERSKFFK